MEAICANWSYYPYEPYKEDISVVLSVTQYNVWFEEMEASELIQVCDRNFTTLSQ